MVEQYQSIKNYITTIFGKNAPTAYAIAFAESGKRDKAGNPYFVTSAINSSSVEISVGVFQINLKNISTKVHYDRIPGASLEQKIQWLQNPYNNVLYAYWIYSYSGYHPWSTYSDGTYLKHLQ